MSASSNSRLNKITGIDITPLMDLTFMLLIIFIITVPAMEYSTDVTPPEMNTAKKVEDIENKAVVTLSKDGEIKLNNVTVQRDDLLAAFKKLRMEHEDANLLIISSGDRAYKEVIELHRVAHVAGVKHIYLVTTGEKN